LNVHGEDFLGLARLQAQPANRQCVGERSHRYVDINRTFKLCQLGTRRIGPVAGAVAPEFNCAVMANLANLDLSYRP
jgi:hypothetical protein